MTTALPQNVKDALNYMIHIGYVDLDEELAIVRSYYLKRTPDDLFDDVWALIEEHDEPFAGLPVGRMYWADARRDFLEDLKEAMAED
jgi:hypothetical protein